MTTTNSSYTRYRILVLSFFVAFLMYMDRACIGSAASAIMKEFDIDKVTYGWSASLFNWAYAIFQVPGGWMADRFGPRMILAAAIVWWSLFTAATGLTAGAGSLAAVRALFGIGEAAAFPAASRALVHWLPSRQRAFGQGFQHAGSRLGAALAPAMTVFIIAYFGWRAVFWLFGGIGFVVALVWYVCYRNRPEDHASVRPEELTLLREDKRPGTKPGGETVPWSLIVHSKEVWFLSSMYFCYGWVLWMYLAWFPTYLHEARHFSAMQIGLASSAPLLGATVTNVVGGWVSDQLCRRWNDVRRGRVIVSLCGFILSAIALLPGVRAESAVTSLFWFTVALAALELTVAVSWALSIDIGGRFSGSVSAVMNTQGNLGGAASSVGIGYIASIWGWNWPFVVSSALAFLAALLVSRIDPARSIAD